MSDLSSKFIEKIKSSYAPTGSYIYLGAGILDGQVYSEAEVNLSLKMMNRHGLIAGATGTGKTRTLQLLAEQLSDASVPVFMLDVKGDLSGLNQPGAINPKIEERAQQLNKPFSPTGFPVEIYSLSGQNGFTDAGNRVRIWSNAFIESIRFKRYAVRRYGSNI
jgi:hypothetical protein